MRSSRDTYGIKTMRPGQHRSVPGKTRDQFRRVLVSYYQRHEWLRHKVFQWIVQDGNLIVTRVR